MHQIVLVNLKDIKDMAISEAQPMLYFLTLAIVGSGILMTLSSLWNFFASSKENQCLIAMVSGVFFFKNSKLHMLWYIFNFPTLFSTEFQNKRAGISKNFYPSLLLFTIINRVNQEWIESFLEFPLFFFNSVENSAGKLKTYQRIYNYEFEI